MTRSETLALAAAALAAAAPASADARQRPPVALTASPATLVVRAGGGRSAVTLRNLGSTRLVVRVATSGIAVDLRGRPRLVRRPPAGRNAAPWLRVRPRRIALPAGAARTVAVAVRLPRRPQPGEHHAAVVFSTLPLDRVRVGVRMRLAVRVTVRTPGVVRRRLIVRSLRVRPAGRARRLVLRVQNRGNVTEQLSRRIAIVLATRPAAVLRVRTGRSVLPGREGVLTVVYRGRDRGTVVARVSVRGGAPRTFRIRL